MKVKVKVYKYMGMLNREFSSVKQAQRTAELAAEKYPDMKFEPDIEIPDVSAIDLSDFGKDDIQEVNPWYNFDRPQSHA
ncbi:MAG: hypothetical protein JSV50_11940 [Desulfobacteraceae bacterium]|jgi:DNA phosphorothioation-dependent restriction protein DptG|nr:MAG: hypothetical protein JSV50_11940 [Desulfobacteraceae bacterium]